jgi:hypothetical protein
MQSTGRTPILSPEERLRELINRQQSDDQKRDSRHSMMKVVAKATDVLVKRAPVANRGMLPQTQWDYHERITTCLPPEEQRHDKIH